MAVASETTTLQNHGERIAALENNQQHWSDARLDRLGLHA